jgi:hypothetical protein
VKYAFPLDEDEVLESDYLQLNKETLEGDGVYNYSVSMDTVHTYVISRDDDIKKVLELCLSRGGAQLQNAQSTNVAPNDPDNYMTNARREELFNLSLSLY